MMSITLSALLRQTKSIVLGMKDDPEPTDHPMRASMLKARVLINKLREKYVESGWYSKQVADDTSEILDNCSRCIGILLRRVAFLYIEEKVTPELVSVFLEIMDVVLEELDNLVKGRVPDGKKKSKYLGYFTEWQVTRWEHEAETQKPQLLVELREGLKAKLKKAEDVAKKAKEAAKKADDAAMKLRSEIEQIRRQVRLIITEDKASKMIEKMNVLVDAMERSSSRAEDPTKVAIEEDKLQTSEKTTQVFSLPSKRARSDVRV